MRIGIRAHDVAYAPLEELIPNIHAQGFHCMHIALSKSIKEFKPGVETMTPGLAMYIKELCTENKVDVAGQLNKVTEFIKPLLDAGIIVSLFIDPDEEQVRASAKTGAQFIEMHTGAYAENFGYKEEEEEFQKLKKSAELAQSLDLQVNAGHGLNYENVHRMHEIKGLHELNIGHSIISRAVFTGLPEAVSKMKEMIK